jgi:hypothetical protein
MGRIVMHLRIIFMLLPVMLGILFVSFGSASHVIRSFTQLRVF